MFVAATIVSLVLVLALALVFVGAGSQKLMAKPAMVEAAHHFGIPFSQYRLIGVAGLAGAAGLLVGIAVHGLGVAAGVCLALLMFGAVAFHLRAKDKPALGLPATVLGIVSAVAAYLWLSV